MDIGHRGNGDAADLLPRLAAGRHGGDHARRHRRQPSTSSCQPLAVSAEAKLELGAFHGGELYCIYNLIQVDFCMLLTNLQAATMLDGYGLDRGCGGADRGRPDRMGRPARQRRRRDHAIDCGGRLLTPGLIDCHTHLVYGGNRANEFELRLTGVLLCRDRQGGRRHRSHRPRHPQPSRRRRLLASALKRLDTLLAEGVTTIEIKSGYGLDVDTELKMLRVARRARPVTGRSMSRTTFLGAHAFPPEFRDDRADYLDARLRAGPARRGQGRPCRCGRRLLRRHRLLGRRDASRFSRPPRRMACPSSFMPSSSPTSAARSSPPAMARSRSTTSNISTTRAWMPSRPSGTVAVLLPGAFYYLREKQAAARCRIALDERSDRDCDRPQPRLLARPLPARHHEHGLRPLWPHAGGSAAGRHRQRRPRPWPQRSRPHRPRSARPISRCGTSNAPASLPIRWASIRSPPSSAMASSSGDRSHERRCTALCQGQGSHPGPDPLRRLGAGRARALRERAGRELRHQPHDRQPGAARTHRRGLSSSACRASAPSSRSRPPAPACWSSATSPRRSPSAAIATPPASPRERRLQPIRHWPRSSRTARPAPPLPHRASCTRRTACPFSSRTAHVNPDAGARLPRPGLQPDHAHRRSPRRPAGRRARTHGRGGHCRHLEQQRLLGIDALEPCLALHRRSWSRGQVVTVATLTYPASRYALYSRYSTSASGTLTQ